jgi:glycosyltransferase involved in cell wall biosynthesis
MPIFTIITVCFNEARNIKKTLESTVSQTFTDYELIVVDGASTDGTKDIILQYEKHLSWWCSEPDRGIYHAMNKGVTHATGDYVIFMNAGDWFHDRHVLEHVCQEGMHADVIEGHTIRTDTGKRLKPRYDDLVQRLLSDSISHQSTFIRRQLLLSHPYDEKYKIVADWKFWLETLIIEDHTYTFSDLDIAYFDMSGISFTQIEQREAEREAVYRELFPPHVVRLIHSYLRAYHLALVKYAVYLHEHSNKGYELVRKIAKRIVSLTTLLH